MTDWLVDGGAGAPGASRREGRVKASPRITRLVVVGLSVAATALLGVGAGPAFAVSHVFSTTFGSSGSGAGQLSLTPTNNLFSSTAGGGVAVDDSTGDVYVADPGNRRVDKFDAAGDFILAFGKDVDQTTGGDVCTAASGDVCQVGTYVARGVGALDSPTFIAVDNSSGPSAGDVYVGDAGPDIVSKFTSSGDYVSGADNDGSASNIYAYRGQGGIDGISVDPDGNLWVYAHYIYEFAQAGAFVQTWDPQFVADADGDRDLAVSRNHVFLIGGGYSVNRYSRTGLLDGVVNRTNEVEASRIALDPATEDLYVSAETAVDHYNASCAPVVVEPGAARGDRTGCPPSDVFGSGTLTDSVGIALNDETSTLYVADRSNDRITIFVAPAPGAPVIANQWASSVGSVSAVVNAAINPMGHGASCQLQYADDPSFQVHGFTGATTVPCDPADLGPRFADHPVQVDLGGLAPGTLYHYRFLASSSGGSDTGSGRPFATEIPEMTLPDGRVYEQVSPANKDLGGIRTDSNFQAAIDGDRMAFSAFTALPGSASDGKQFLSTRGTTGWSTINQIPPQSQGASGCALIGATVSVHSADLSKGILQDGINQGSYFPCGKDDPILVPGEPEGVQNLFVRDNAGATYQLVSPNPVAGAPGDALIGAADPTLRHVVFSEAAQLTPGAPANVGNLYEWSAGAVALVSIAPDGTPLPGGAVAAGRGYLAFHPVSDDGSKVFFQGADGDLYARVDGTSTVQLDAAHGAGPGGGGSFLYASSDGSKVFFSDDASAGLTTDTVSGSGSNLYRYDVSTGRLTDLTPAADVGVLGLVGGGESGADVYFVAAGDLAGAATTGQPNLYVSHDGALTFIGTLSPLSDPDGTFASSDQLCVWQHPSGQESCAQVSADGSHLAFQSEHSLTSADDTGGHTEVYLYDRTTADLVCTSCPSSGAQTTANATIGRAPDISTLNGTVAVPRNLSADGSRLFFTADGSLVARDTNGYSDVYEYSGGKLHLISTGTATTNSVFLGASATGDDVFIATEQQLTSSDTDGARDVYDARVGGGFSEPPPAAPCTGDACKGLLGGAPATLAAASVGFAGPGNPTADIGKPMAKVKATGKVVAGSRLVYTVRVPAKGRVTISGANLKKVQKAAAKAGIYRVTVSLSTAGKRALRRKHTLTLKTRVAYTPDKGAASSTSVSVIVKRGGQR
jgi:hypothetical protein